jgi:Immunoglobulin domain/Pro-kumamolisin, activation domain/NHL repeat
MAGLGLLPEGSGWRRPGRRGGSLLLAAVLCSGAPLRAQAGNEARVLLPDSIVETRALTFAATPHAPAPVVERTALTAAEEDAPMEIEFAFRMRSFAELQARVARREIISRQEMAAQYLPAAADYEQVASWLAGSGLTITYRDPSHLGLFARGSVARIARLLGAEFARVTYHGGTYTSAISAPSVPTALAPALLGVNGLQPHLQAHKLQMRPMAVVNPPYSPAQVLRAYNATATNLDGSGQTVATVIDTFPNDADLTAFWARYNIPETLANVTKIQVVGGALPTPSGEESVDVEWSTAIAPGIKVRVYAVNQLLLSNLDQAYLRIYADLPSIAGFNQLMLCFGANEADASDAQLLTEAQNIATLASTGLTIFASSGDGGSNPDPGTGRYNAAAATQVIYPAGDPNVTAVGATSLTLDDSAGGTVTGETGWSGTGGGIGITRLAALARPSWQTGTGVPAGTGRLVPDVALTGDPNLGALIALNGQFVQGGGTSLSAPIWAGLCALLNEARTNAGQGPLGMLGPSIYPLLGTTGFRDITSGTNGAYGAGPGYDMVTGIGVPNVAALLQALVANFAPVITSQPAGQTVRAGQNAVFAVTANGNPPPTYQWQRAPAGSTTWSPLGDTAAYTGTATATLTVNAVTEAMSGDAFRCQVANAPGTTASASAPLIVAQPLAFTTLAGQAGVSGSTDGTGSAAAFFDPSDLAVDSSGNLYVADTNNQTIRKITPAGAVTTLAGLAGAKGTADGAGSAARFFRPMGIAIDSTGSLYVADSGNETIRKVSPAGNVTTFAGQPNVDGTADGPAASASFMNPSDVTLDASGNLYVADTANSTIRKITPAGIVSTLAGRANTAGHTDGDGSAALFYSPEGVAADSSGNVYVADTVNGTIRRVSPGGLVTTVAGQAPGNGSADGVGSAARFSYPADLIVDGAGNLFVADTDNHTIRRISPAGVVATVAGFSGQAGNADGVGSDARFHYPTGIAVDGAGTVYVADTSNHTIRKGVVPAAPVIQTQPQSQTVNVGANVQFTVTAAGAPAPTYQWKKDGTAIGGATSSSLSLGNVQTADAGNYAVVVGNAFGDVTSNAAALTVNVPAPPPSGGGSSGGGGGGGGALPVWFAGALFALGAARWRTGRQTRR